MALPTPVADAKGQVTYLEGLEKSANWRGTGYTTEGLELSYEPDYGDVEVDQLLDSARIYKQSMRVSLNTTLVEATLENLIVAWGQEASSLEGSLTVAVGEQTLTIEGGSLGDAPVERSLVAVGPAPKSGASRVERVYQAFRVLSVENTTVALRRNEATMFPVSFRCLPNDNADYGVIKDRKVTTGTAPATP